MNFTINILIKLAITFIAAVIAFTQVNNPLGTILIFSIITVALNYFLGDLIILPSQGNIVASITDGVIGAILAYVYAFLIPAFNVNLFAALVFAILIAIAEYVFHNYIVDTNQAA